MTWRGFTSGLLLLVSALLCGLIVGGAVAGRLMPASPGEMGWDRLADALGGMAVGAVVGLSAALYFVRRWSVRQRLVTAAVLIVVAISVTAVLRATRPGSSLDPAASQPQSTTPTQ